MYFLPSSRLELKIVCSCYSYHDHKVTKQQYTASAAGLFTFNKSTALHKTQLKRYDNNNNHFNEYRNGLA